MRKLLTLEIQMKIRVTTSQQKLCITQRKRIQKGLRNRIMSITPKLVC